MAEELRLALPLPYAAVAEVDIAALVEQYSTLLFRVAYSIVRSNAEAEDVVQDVFVRVLQHRGALPEVRDMRVWLVRIAWNLAVDRKRRTRPEQMDEFAMQQLAGTQAPADSMLANAERVDAVYRAIDRLPSVEKEALLLSTLQELSTAEVARVMGKSESAVRALLFRARAHLRERLAQGGSR